MKTLTKALLKVIQIIEGGAIPLQFVKPIGFCNVYKASYESVKTTGFIVSSSPYKTQALALSSRSANPISKYLGTMQVYVNVCSEDDGNVNNNVK